MSRTRLWAVFVVGVMLVASGCGGVTNGVPIAATSTVDVPASIGAWDPCAIPDEAIDSAGLAVETKTTNLVGEMPISVDWSTCIWTNPLPVTWFHLGIFSSTYTLDYLRERGPFEQFTAIDGFDGLRFQRTIQYDEVSCGIAIGHGGGVTYFILDGFASQEPLEDPCVVVERVARSLRPYLPSPN